MPPTRDWFDVLVDSQVFEWDMPAVLSSGTCLKMNQAFQGSVTPHEEHHINELEEVLRKFFMNSNSVVLAGCNADRTANATTAENNAKAELSGFENKLLKSARKKIEKELDRKAAAFHRSPQGQPPDFDCKKCPSLLPHSKGWCTPLPKGQPEKCGFKTATQACEKAYNAFIDNKDEVTFGGSEPGTQWNQSMCIWAGTGSFIHPVPVEYKCNSVKPTATAPWSCSPPP
jgi:hypothetical protein